MAKKRRRADKVKWPGVYVYELDAKVNGKQDAAFYISFKDGTKKVWERLAQV